MVKIIRKIDDRVVNFFVNNTLYELLQGLKNAVDNHNTSVVMVVDGRSGMGKTTLANQIGITLDKNYNLKKLHYNPESFMNGLAESKKGDFILFDEAMILSNRSTMSEINRMVMQAMSMIRSKQIYVCFCVNSIFDLDRNLAISRADMLLHVYGQTLINRGRFAGFFRGKDGYDRLKDLYLKGKKWYDYSQPKANFTGTFPKEFVVDEKKYEDQKQEGVNLFLQKKEKSGTKAARGRNKLIKHLVDKKLMNVTEIADISGLHRTQIYNIRKTLMETS